MISLGVWGAPFETQGKKVLRPYMSATTAGLRLGLKLRSFGGFRPPQDDRLFDISKRWWRWLRHQRFVFLVL